MVVPWPLYVHYGTQTHTSYLTLTLTKNIVKKCGKKLNSMTKPRTREKRSNDSAT